MIAVNNLLQHKLITFNIFTDAKKCSRYMVFIKNIHDLIGISAGRAIIKTDRNLFFIIASLVQHLHIKIGRHTVAAIKKDQRVYQKENDIIIPGYIASYIPYNYCSQQNTKQNIYISEG
jgi:hypothetical protein